MKICLSVVTLMLSLAFAQSSTYTFADIPWLSSKEEVVDAMEARNYTVNSNMSSTELTIFNTKENLLGRTIAIFASFNQGEQLVRMGVYLFPNHDLPQDQLRRDTEEVFSNLKELLKEKYGYTAYDFEFPPKLHDTGSSFEELIAAGDEITAITHWFSDTDSSELYVSAKQNSIITVAYLSPHWEAEPKRRQGPLANDL